MIARPRLPIAILMLCAAFSARAQDAKLADSVSGVRVNLFRTHFLYQILGRPSVFCDGKELVRMQDGRRIVLALAPGSHTFSLTTDGDPRYQVRVDLKEGEEYYVRVKIVIEGDPEIILVPQNKGPKEMKGTTPADKKMIKDASLLASDFKPKG